MAKKYPAQKLNNKKSFTKTLKNTFATKEGRKKIWKLFFGMFVLGFFGLVVLFAWYAKDLPTPGKIRERQQVESTKIYDRNDKLLYEIHGNKRRTILSSQDIPDLVKQATVAVEDKNFYEHHGFDIRGIARSVLSNITSGTKIGGSTLTQQFVKNALLTNQKTIDRKIKELILSLEIEAMFSKDEILTMYLNEIPYGSVNYGIQSASQYFFGKEVKDLQLHEIAMLVAIPQRPTYYSPYGTNTSQLKDRRNFVLDSMVELGNITQEQSDKAKAKPIKVIPQNSSIKAPHFVFYVKEQLVAEYGEEIVEEGGLKIKTTLDLELQNIAQQAVTDGVERQQFRKVSNGALAAIDPNTGEILAMVGSKDYFDTENDGNVNVTVTNQQPGSSFKPIVVAAAFKENFSPATTLWDVKTDFNGYSPNNYDLRQRGPVNIRYALGNSLNIPMVKILSIIGLDKAIATARDIGITTLTDPSRYGLSLVLGGGDVRPLDMATAFGVFAAEGTYRPPVSILKVEDSQSRILFEHKKGKGEKEVLAKEIAYQISHILSDNNARAATFGTRSQLYFGSRPVAAKTGTTQEYRDAWTVGYTPDIAVAVWIGNNDNSPMLQAAGALGAAPIFHEFIEKSHADKPIKQFNRPKTISTLKVDKLSAKLPTEDSPETIVDIFAPWQKPTQKDDIHVRVKINKKNNKLATEFTPVSLVEEKLFTVIHSEKPDDPRWENPVIAFAKSMGLNITKPPTENDDMYDENKIPQGSFSNLSDNDVVSEPKNIEVDASATYTVAKVELYVDNVLADSDTLKPYIFAFDPSVYGSGEHILTLRIIDKNGAEAKTSIDITIVGDTNAPESVSDATATGISSGVKLNWNNPNNSDLEKILIYFSTNPAELGVKHNTEIFVEPSSATTYTVSGLSALTTYYFTLRPVDIWGNERQDGPFSTSAIALP